MAAAVSTLVVTATWRRRQNAGCDDGADSRYDKRRDGFFAIRVLYFKRAPRNRPGAFAVAESVSRLGRGSWLSRSDGAATVVPPSRNS